MLAALLLTCLAHDYGVTSSIQAAGRTPIPSAQEELARSLRAMPLSELLALQPGRARIKQNGEWILRPEVAEMQRRVADGSLSPDDWRAALTDTNLIFTRSRWPAGVPLQLGIGYQAWLPYSMITVRAIDPELGEVWFDDREPSRCGTCDEFRHARARHLAMAPLPEGTKTVAFEVTVLQREYSDKPRSRSKNDHPLWKGRLERQIEAVASVADVLPASTEESDRDAIRSCLSASWSREPEPTDQLHIFLFGRYEETPALRGLGVGLTVELWNDTALVQSGNLVAYSRPSFTGEFDECQGDVTMTGIPEAMRSKEFDLSKWELRVRANPEGVPGIWDADRWWNGSFSMPLAEALKKTEDR